MTLMRRREWAPAAAVVGGWVLLALTVPLLDANRSIAVATANPTTVALTVAAAITLLAGALAAALRPASGPLATLLTVVAVAWLAPVWVGWGEGPTVVRTIATLLPPLAAPLLFHVTLAGPRGRLGTRGERILVTSLMGAFAAVVLTLVLVRDPFLDRHCWSNCTANDLLVAPVPRLAAVLTTTLLWATIAVAVATAVAALVRVRDAGADRKPVAAVCIPAATAVAAESARAALLLANPAESVGATPTEAHVWLFAARAIALAALGAGVIWAIATERARRHRIARLADELGASPEAGTLQRTLAAILGDPRLEVLYRLPGTTRMVDASGVDRSIARAPGRAIAEIRRGEDVVAVIVHDDALRGLPALPEQIGAAARLAIDNERLHVGVLAHLHELRASRARVVDSADAARRVIERNIHDGAQQSLVALLYELSLARIAATNTGAGARADALAEAQAATGRILDRLRTLAHGPIPAILDDVGLEAALRRLSEEAALDVDLSELPQALPSAVQRTAYLVVVSAVDAQADSEPLMAELHLDGAALVVHVTGAAPTDPEPLRDRVGALGGTVETAPGRMTAVIPCE